jgi:radical SAM superfamily enzyme YgiQ (UPF0313 family)
MVIDIAEAGLSLQEVGRYIRDINPFVIGITSMTPQLQGAVELARYLKNQLFFDKKIFLGGSHISGDPDFINRYGDIFDYAITGEGEKTFLESITKLLNGETIPIIQHGDIIADLDTIPFPDKTLINRRKYSKYESMIFSRGCPYDCYYCSRPAISKKVRYRSVTNMLEEIENVYDFWGGKINFQDDAMTINRKRILELCNEITKRSLKLEWECNTRIDLVDEELLAIMKKAGCSLIHFGIESGNEQLRKNQIRKGNFTNWQIKKVFSWCRKHGIKIACYFMIGHPGETKETLEETKKMILESKIDLVGVSIPTPFPSSELYDISEKIGLINRNIIDAFAEKKLGEGYVGNFPIYVPDGIEKEYLFNVMKDINRKFYINFKTFCKSCKKDFFSPKNLKKDAVDLMSLLINGVSSRKPYKNKKKI